MKFPSLGILLTLALFLVTGCEHDPYYENLYQARCPEAKVVAFKDLGPSSTCRGNPIVFELARIKIPEDHNPEAVAAFFKGRGFDFDAQEPGTGRTPLMIAMMMGDLHTIEVFFRVSTKRNLLDNAGNHYLHYASRLNWRTDMGYSIPVNHYEVPRYPESYSKESLQEFYIKRAERRGDISRFLPGGVDLEVRNGAGLTPAEYAYREGNWEVLWSLIKAGARVDFLTEDPQSIDPGFLLHELATDNLTWFDKVPELLDHKFNGSVYVSFKDRRAGKVTTLNNFTLAKQAQRTCSIELINYLMARKIMSPVICEQNALEDWEYPKLIRYFKGEDTFSFYENWWMLDETNLFRQNFSHVYFTHRTAMQMNSDFGVWYGGFDLFVQMATTRKWLDAVDVFGNTPAYYWLTGHEQMESTDLISRKRMEIRFRSLLTAMSNRLAVNQLGESLLSAAVATGNAKLVKIAFEIEPEMKTLVNKANHLGKTPLTLAQEKGFKDIYAILVQWR